jgi:transcriptional regulator with XRE-family HTH domain
MFGSNLKKILKERNITILSLAKTSGVPKSTLHAWTTGQDTVSLSQLKAVAETLKLPLHDLAYGGQDPHTLNDKVDFHEIFNEDVRLIIKRIKK